MELFSRDVVGRLKVRKACTLCQMLKVKCDDQRPCSSCVRRGTEADCRNRDEPPQSDVDRKSPFSFFDDDDSLSLTEMFSAAHFNIPKELNFSFWEQFRGGLTPTVLLKACTWFKNYSPMYLYEMHEANTLSRRKYLNFVGHISSEETRTVVLEEMASLACSVGDVKRFDYMMGVPYARVYAEVDCTNEMHIPEALFTAITNLWPRVSNSKAVHDSICVYQVQLQEEIDLSLLEPICKVSVQFNQQFAKIMNTSVFFLQQAMSEGKGLSFRIPNPPFWIFASEHWDVVMEFVLLSFFNQCNVMKGTFRLANWDQTFKENPFIANVLSHSSHDEKYSTITFSFAFRTIQCDD
jgi:hypothetical protein